jgi:hypothetical protein
MITIKNVDFKKALTLVVERESSFLDNAGEQLLIGRTGSGRRSLSIVGSGVLAEALREELHKLLDRDHDEDFSSWYSDTKFTFAEAIASAAEKVKAPERCTVQLSGMELSSYFLGTVLRDLTGEGSGSVPILVDGIETSVRWKVEGLASEAEIELFAEFDIEEVRQVISCLGRLPRSILSLTRFRAGDIGDISVRLKKRTGETIISAPGIATVVIPAILRGAFVEGLSL